MSASPSRDLRKQIIYRAVGYDDFPPLHTSAMAAYLFASPHAPLDSSPAYIDAETGKTLSREQTYDLCLRLAKAVDDLGFGFKRGVAMIFSPNSLAWPIVFLGLLTNCVRTTMANSSYTPTELAHQIHDSGASLIFVHPTLHSTLVSTLALLEVSKEEMKRRVVIMSYIEADLRLEIELGIDRSWTRLADLLERGKLNAPVQLSDAETDETAIMCYSSGTTGLSKGVETTHRNVVTVMQIYLPVSPPVNRFVDVELCILPLYHVFGILKSLSTSFLLGMPVVIMPKFEPPTFFRAIERYKVSVIRLVPPVLVVFATHPSFTQHDLSSLQYVVSGAAPLGEGLANRVITRFREYHRKGGIIHGGDGRRRDLAVIQGYGLTETSPTSTFLPYDDAVRKNGSCGVLLPTLEARIVDDNDQDVEPGLPGELWLRGNSIMKGYLNNPKATKDSITTDGWFKSGDVATRDDEGYYYIVDRKKELIKYKGFQVPPAELEAVLLSKEDIADCGVIGIENVEQATEIPRAYIVSTNNEVLLADPQARAAFEREVEEWIKTKVARHKYLRGGVHVIEAIPKSGSGKILRKELRALAKEEAKKAFASRTPIASAKL